MTSGIICQLVPVGPEPHPCALFAPGNQAGRQSVSLGGGPACTGAREGADCNLLSEAWQPQRSSVSHTQV